MLNLPIKNVIVSTPRQTLSEVEEQFNTFVSIKEQYLQPTSPQEVNISSRMQGKIASLHDEERFSALNEDSRLDVLQEPLKEIVRMLEQNLLANFKKSPEMCKWRENAKRQSICESCSCLSANKMTCARRKIVESE